MDIAAACSDLFKRNRVEAFDGVFHVPCVDEYPCLFAWDSGYHALALRNIDRAAAIEELTTLYRANTTDDGFLAHERPIPVAADRTQFVIETIGPIYRADFKSWLIDPPVAAYAAGELFEARGDARLLEAASTHLLAIDRLRTFAPGGLPVILHPLEFGADASPLFDALIDVSSNNAYIANLHELSHGLADCRGTFEHAKISGYRFVVSDPIFCSWYLLALEAVAAAWKRVGDEQRSAEFEARAESIAEQMRRLLWSEEHSLFVGYDHIAQRPLNVATLGGVIAAASDNMIASGIGRRVADAHVREESSQFWGAAGIAFNPLDGENPYQSGMLWRGPVASGATHYWSYLVAMKNGNPAAGLSACQKLAALIEKSAFREFYDARTGDGLGAGDPGGFTWPTLVLDMSAILGEGQI